MKNVITQQIMHEFVRSNPRFSNINKLLEKIPSSPIELREKQTYKKGKMVFLGEYITYEKPVTESKRVVSKTLSELKPVRDLSNVSQILGLNVSTSSRPSFEPDSRTLFLSKKGALGAAFFSHFFRIKLTEKTKTVFLNLLGSGKLPKTATSKDIATALFFLHVATNGVESSFADLYLNKNCLEWLKAGGRLAETTQIKNNLLRLQLEYAKKLY